MLLNRHLVYCLCTKGSKKKTLALKWRGIRICVYAEPLFLKSHMFSTHVKHVMLQCACFLKLSSISAAFRTVFSAPVQEAPTSSVCPIKKHCEWGVPESRVSKFVCDCPARFSPMNHVNSTYWKCILNIMASLVGNALFTFDHTSWSTLIQVLLSTDLSHLPVWILPFSQVYFVNTQYEIHILVYHTSASIHAKNYCVICYCSSSHVLYNLILSHLWFQTHISWLHEMWPLCSVLHQWLWRRWWLLLLYLPSLLVGVQPAQ